MSIIGLADAIETVRGELSEAIKKGEGQALRFVVEGIELEFAVEMIDEGTTSGKVKINVLGLGAELGGSGGGKQKDANRIKINLKLAGDPQNTLIAAAASQKPK